MRLSNIEQSPRLRTIYTQLCFCYENPNLSPSVVIDTLSKGLATLATTFPWTAEQVVLDEGHDGQLCFFKTSPLGSTAVLVEKHHEETGSGLSMEKLRQAKCPFSLLDEGLLCPRSTLSIRPDETTAHPYPVLLLQANFIEGGLLLVLAASHAVMDLMGQVTIMRLLSKACHGEAFTVEELAIGNIDRRNLIPVLADKDGVAIIETRSQIESDPSPADVEQPKITESQELVWAYFLFEADKLKQLTAQAMKDMLSSTTFLSTDDCISALIWKSAARARANRVEPSSYLKFARQVDARHFMEIHLSYTGNLASSIVIEASLQQIIDEPLGVTASKLRAALEPNVIVQQVHTDATRQSNEAVRKATNPKSSKDRSNTIEMSSWAKAADCWDFDFNLGLGKPVYIRRPKFTPIEGIVYLMPKSPTGQIAAGLCLKQSDIENLRHDNAFTEYAEYIG